MRSRAIRIGKLSSLAFKSKAFFSCPLLYGAFHFTTNYCESESFRNAYTKIRLDDFWIAVGQHGKPTSLIISWIVLIISIQAIATPLSSPGNHQKRAIPRSSVPPTMAPYDRADYVYDPEKEESGFDRRTARTFDSDAGASHTTKRSPTDLERRYDGWEATPICNKESFGGKADYNQVNELMDTLLMQNGKPEVGAGPKKCAMAGCKNGNSIWFCNDVSLSFRVYSSHSPFLMLNFVLCVDEKGSNHRLLL